MENLKPLRQSNFSTACIRPRLPSWIRSRSGQARGLVLLGDRDDQPQVRLHEGLLGLLALHDGAAKLALLGRGQPLGRLGHVGLGVPPGLDGLGQPDLVVLGQQRVLTDVCQVEPDEILVVALNSFLGQNLRQTFRPMTSAGEPGRAVALVKSQPTPVSGVRGLPRQCNGAVKMRVQQGKRASRQTPVRVRRPSAASLVSPSADPPQEGATTADLAGQVPVGSRQDLQDRSPR